METLAKFLTLFEQFKQKLEVRFNKIEASIVKLNKTSVESSQIHQYYSRDSLPEPVIAKLIEIAKEEDCSVEEVSVCILCRRGLYRVPRGSDKTEFTCLELGSNIVADDCYSIELR